jgi:hypothetical protein
MILNCLNIILILNIDKLTSLIDTLTLFFEYVDIILRIHWYSLIESDKNSFVCLDSNKQFCLSSLHFEKKETSLSKEKLFSQLFNFMKWSRLTSFLLLTSFVLMSKLSLFQYCLFSFSSFSFSWSFSFSVSFSVSFSSSTRDWISSINNKRYLWIHLI